VLLVVVEDFLDGDDAGIFVALEVLACRFLVPIEDLSSSTVNIHIRIIVDVDVSEDYTYTTNEGRDEGDASLGACDCLAKTEEEGEIAVDPIFLLEFAGSLDAFPSRGDFDEDAFLLDPYGVVQRDKFLRLCHIHDQSRVGIDGETE
jgi:hypothetical protein